jgi:Protein of unknown function (DUF4242)
METYVILRRSGWSNGEDLRAGAERSTLEGEKTPDEVRWIRSYVLVEEDGTLGTVCIYQASGPDAIRAHAARAGLPATEVIPAADTVIVRPDPERFTAPTGREESP